MCNLINTPTPRNTSRQTYIHLKNGNGPTSSASMPLSSSRSAALTLLSIFSIGNVADRRDSCFTRAATSCLRLRSLATGFPTERRARRTEACPAGTTLLITSGVNTKSLDITRCKNSLLWPMVFGWFSARIYTSSRGTRKAGGGRGAISVSPVDKPSSANADSF